MTKQNMRECCRCHRVGYRGFVPVGGYGWECSNDRACNRRAAKQVTAEDWQQMAHKLAARVANWVCDIHPLDTPDPSCGYCQDREAYREYLRLCALAGVRRQRTPLEAALKAARPIPLEKVGA